MTGFTENIQRVTGVDVEREDDGSATLAIHVVTRGGIKKTIRVPHYWADLLRSFLTTELDDMGTDFRRLSFWLSAPGTEEHKVAFMGPKPGTISASV